MAWTEKDIPDLSGRTAVVTGANGGLGLQTSLALAGAGAHVVLAARDPSKTTAAVARIVERYPAASLEVVELDLGDLSVVRGAAEKVRAGHERVDVLVNNAGVMLLGTIRGADTEEWRRMINTNVLGLMYMTHAAIDGMVAQGSGDIVNVSSVAGRVARVGSGVYNASKWAVNAFSESLRQEVTTKGVRIGLVEPGAVDTELSSHITHPGAKAAAEKMRESMRVLQSDDIARAVLYLVTQPPHVAINEVLVRPTDQER